MSGRGRADLSQFHYTKPSSGGKRKQASTSSTSDSGVSPESTLKTKEKKAGRERETKKIKQIVDKSEEEMSRPVTLGELQTLLEKLSTKEDIKSITERLNSVNDGLLRRLDILEGKLFELEEEKDRLSGDVRRLQDENASLRGQLEQRKKEMAGLRTAHNDHEQHGRAWNVRVYGIREEKAGEETAERCLQKCLKVFNEQVGVAVSEKDVEVAHRAGKPGGARPRPVLLRFFSRLKKGQVLSERRKLKNSGVSISEDLTMANYQLLTRASKHSATLAAWSANGKIITKLKNGKTLHLTIDGDLDDVLAKAMA